MYLLFKHVVSAGGMQNVVSNEGTWANIFRQLPNYSPTETSASYRLKKIYEKYLWDYEQDYYSHLGSGLLAPAGSNGNGSKGSGKKFDWATEKQNMKKRAAIAMSVSSSSSSSSSSGVPNIKRRHISNHALLSSGSSTRMMTSDIFGNGDNSSSNNSTVHKIREGSDALFKNMNDVDETFEVEGFTIQSTNIG
jgi:hypothetical protein